MNKLLHLMARVVGWPLSPVDDPLPPNVVPMPGPAHSPIPAIDLRVGASLEAQRRRKAS